MFCAASGQKVNFEKFFLFVSASVDPTIAHDIATISGIPLTTDFFFEGILEFQLSMGECSPVLTAMSWIVSLKGWQVEKAEVYHLLVV